MIDFTKLITDTTNKKEHTLLALNANKVLESIGVLVKITSITALQRNYGLQGV